MSKVNYILVVLAITITDVNAAEFRCKASDTCICIANRANRSFEFYCPSSEINNVTITVIPLKSYVQITCQEQNSLNTEKLLPKVPIRYVNNVQFKNCLLPKPNFAELMERLGIESVERIGFQTKTESEYPILISDYFENLVNLKSISISKSFIKDIDENTFRSMSNLSESLDLSDNEISVLNINIFKNLRKLQSLVLHSNRLTTVNREIFEDLRNLKNLDLSNNYMEILLEDVFYDLINLKWLNLTNNRVQRLPENLFLHNVHLEGIRMDMNSRLTKLHSNLFFNLTKLGYINLSYCGIENIPEGLFDTSTNLKNISFAGNEIKILQEYMFKNLTQLQHLDLSYNKLKDIPDKLLSSTAKLLTLNLQNNLLQTIRKNIFYSLLNLQTINLSNNNISFIHMESFVRMIKLKEIFMANNTYEVPSGIFYGISSPFNANLELEKIDFSNNRISIMSEDWIHTLIHLKELNLTHNRITYVNIGDLLSVSQKLTIDLTHNEISTVDFDRANDIIKTNEDSNKNLQLYLNENPVMCDCFLNSFLEYIRNKEEHKWITIVVTNLTCTNAKLKNSLVKEIHPAMLTCSFEQLHLGNYCSTDCTCEFRPWDKSLIFDCSYKNLTDYPDLIFPAQNFYNQTEIRLEGNLLRSGLRYKSDYENVTKMIISNNDIQGITWLPSNLETLWLDHNNITYLNGSSLTILNSSHLKYLRLGNNPWECDCLTASFKEFLVARLSILQIDTEDIKCYNTGKPLINISSSILCPTYTALIVSLVVVLIFMAITIAVLTVLFYRFNYAIKIWLFKHRMCLWYVTEEEYDKDKLYDAFISYCSTDEEFVTNEFLPILEKGRCRYKIYLQSRDWEGGILLTEQISKSVEKSRRTLIILSPAYLESLWGRVEFRAAHKEAMSKKNTKVVVIIYGDVDLNNGLDEELRAYIRTNTYVKWDDPWFWDKIRYAMPHVKIRKRQIRCKTISENELDSEL